MSVATNTFFNAYAQLIALAPDAPSDTFYGTEDYNKLESLGPTLPKLPYLLPLTAVESKNEDLVTVNVKSIKPPFKFATLLAGVSLGQSIYKIKTTLVEVEDILKNAGVSPGDLKFMIKAKVVSDSTLLSSLVSGDSDISLTVLVSTPTNAKSVEPPVDSPKEASTVSAATWVKIYELLAADLGTEDAKSALEKFKTLV